VLTLNFTPFPILNTARLHLRNITEDDATDLFALRSNKEVLAYLDRAPAASVDEVVTLIQAIRDMERQNDAITWALSIQGSHQLIGTIGFWKIQKEHYRAEIGYLLQPAHQGKGLMQEALSVVLAYGFQALHLHSVEANVNPANTASIKLLERNGFVQEGYFRENYYFDGRFIDSAIYSLLTPVGHSRVIT
jgi:[ribosomal protein S5]-alanine N-acetyltransferase